MAEEKIYNVAVIGYGFSAKIFHIPFIQQVQSLRLYGIVQRSPTADNDAGRTFPAIKTWRSAEDALGDPEVHVIVITTFPASHFVLTKAALEAGKHVVVEKPWVDSAAEARELIAVAQKVGRKLAVFQNRRYDADFLTVKKLMDSGTFGRLFEFESHFDRYRPEVPTKPVFQDSQQSQYCAGSIYDLGTHLIDQAVLLFGLPASVTAWVISQRSKQSVGGDSFVVVLQYASWHPNLLVTLKGAVLSTEPEQLRFWVRGEKASYKKYNEDVQEPQLLSKSCFPGQPGFGEEPESHYGVLTQANPEGKPVSEKYPTVKPPTYAAFYQQFADALAGKGGLPVEPDIASAVIRIIELANESTRLSRTVDFFF